MGIELASVRASVCASVHTFKYEYFCNQRANCNKILSGASLGWGLPALGFGPDLIRTLVSMATDNSHTRRKCCQHSCAFIFDRIFFVLAGNENNHKSVNELGIRPDPPLDCGVSCP